MKQFVLLIFICLLVDTSVLKAEEVSQEYQLKAAFLVNFARFITWPETSFSPEHPDFTLCIAGENPFGNTLEPARSKKIQGRPVKIVYVHSLQDVPHCQMLYVGRSEQVNLDKLSSINKGRSVVSVSDIPGFSRSGGSIEFTMHENRLSFEINNTQLRQHGMQVSSSMLDLAAAVR